VELVLLFLAAAALVLAAVLSRWALLRYTAGSAIDHRLAGPAADEEVTVAQLWGSAVAGLAMSRLEGAGIRGVLVRTQGGYPYGRSEDYEIRVLGRDVRRARALLSPRRFVARRPAVHVTARGVRTRTYNDGAVSG